MNIKKKKKTETERVTFPTYATFAGALLQMKETETVVAQREQNYAMIRRRKALEATCITFTFYQHIVWSSLVWHCITTAKQLCLVMIES